MNTRFALIALLFLAACSLPTPTPAQPTLPIPESVSAEEYAVYRDVLIDNEEMWNIPAGAENVVVFDHTFLRADPDSVRSILRRRSVASEELIANFLEANKAAYPLEAQFELGVPVVLVSQEDAKNAVRGLKYGEQCSHTLRAMYPFPRYFGWFTVSRVGFDARTKTALVYFESSLCGGEGDFLVLENESGVWKIKAFEPGLQSDLRLDSPMEVSDEEYAVYNAVLIAAKELSLGSTYQYITVYDQTGLSEALVQPGDDLYAATLKNMPAVTKELADNLLTANKKSAYLAPRLAFEVPVVFVSWEEYRFLSRERGEQTCQETVQKRFPTPKFQGWFRLSRVGFNRAMDRALVYVESYVCNGGAYLMLLDKDGDTWRMTANTIVWLT